MSRSAKGSERKGFSREKERGTPALSVVPASAPTSDRFFQVAFYAGLVAITILSGMGFYFYLTHGTFAFESGESYGDRLTNFSLVRTFMEYGFNVYDPFSRQQPVFYSFFFYWMEGGLARLLHVDAWKMANILQLFLGPALFVTFFQLGRAVTGNRWTALVATLMTFFFGNLEFLLRGEVVTQHSYGTMAIIYSFLRQLGGPYCDNYAFLAGYGALYFFWKIATSEGVRIGKKEAFFFILLSAIAFNIQLLVAMLIISLCTAVLFARTIIDGDISSSRLRNWGLAFGLVYLTALFIGNFRLPMPVLALIVGLPFGVFFWFSRQKKAYVLLLGSILPVAAMTATTLYMVSKGGGDPFRYNDRVRELDMAFPPFVYLVSFLPILTLAAIAIWKSENRRMRIYLTAFAIASIGLSYNNFLGYNNHPCRFVTSSFPIMCILAAAGIFRLAAWKRKGVRAGMAILGGLLALGVFQNIVTFAHVAATTSREISPWVDPAVKAIERVRVENKDAVFYVWPLKLHTMNLTPYTGAKFYYHWQFLADTGWDQIFARLDSTPNLDELLRRIWSERLRIDFIVVTGPAPTDGSGVAQGQFVLNENGVSIFKIAKSATN